MQINNNTKTKISVRIDIDIPTFVFPSRPFFHFETKSVVLEVSEFEIDSFSEENLD